MLQRELNSFLLDAKVKAKQFVFGVSSTKRELTMNRRKSAEYLSGERVIHCKKQSKPFANFWELCKHQAVWFGTFFWMSETKGNAMWFRTKKIEKPVSDEVHEVDSVELTYVQWYRRHGAYSHDTEKCIEAFPNHQDALEFADSLKAAYKLLQHTSGTSVKVYKKESDNR